VVGLAPTRDRLLNSPEEHTDRRITGELEAAIGMALMGLDCGAPISLQTAGQNAYFSWLKGPFQEILGPHLLEVARHASNGHVREICEADKGLSLPADSDSEASAAEGSAILEARSGTRACPVLERLRGSVDKGEALGHHATVFAAQAAVNQISHQAILVSFAYDEWRRANDDPGLTSFLEYLPRTLDLVGSLAGEPSQTFRIA